MFKCHVCNSRKLHTDNISEVFQIDGRFQLVENIPTTVCSNCGEAIFSRATTEHIKSMLHSNSQPIETISIDVYVY
ncbi:YgiT-type zinc finger protein [Chamaesiphon sp.]|uniref:YgiT-type zinc finger protein n=1 Tax=Chamaesiphon sp. TaxID=2814140 RepID=UPI0035937879